MDQPVAGRARVEPAVAPSDGFQETVAPPGRVEGNRFARLQHPHAQRRVGVKKANGEKAVPAIINRCKFAKSSRPVLFANALGEQPGVTAPEMPLGIGADAEPQAGPAAAARRGRGRPTFAQSI